MQTLKLATLTKAEIGDMSEEELRSLCEANGLGQPSGREDGIARVVQGALAEIGVTSEIGSGGRVVVTEQAPSGRLRVSAPGDSITEVEVPLPKRASIAHRHSVTRLASNLMNLGHTVAQSFAKAGHLVAERMSRQHARATQQLRLSGRVVKIPSTATERWARIEVMTTQPENFRFGRQGQIRNPMLGLSVSDYMNHPDCIGEDSRRQPDRATRRNHARVIRRSERARLRDLELAVGA